MDYETADGSQFSLREIASEDGASKGTLIAAFVDGRVSKRRNAYAGKSSQNIEELDEVAVIQHLEAVPSENVFPLLPKGFTIAPPFDAKNHYLKAPQFTYDDKHPGNTFVANVLSHEASILEQLRQHPHPSIAQYYGACVKDGRITHLCLKRCYCNLVEYSHVDLSSGDRERLMTEIREGIEHMHSLGMAHNDINPRAQHPIPR
ncbi:3-phosphoinositide-dependent kinase [Lecanosticta acicola]|uniref:3-phosphoinositide-dependent kinase n=1 Tax=Lecanosticta acicola TaxID=111012 RepID=A0AAI8Z3D0_9PEZI|nr:3-phosphoinositide-dependent kinase [Lecanosticta acicola]